MIVWGSLTNSWEKKRSKGKGEKERYTQLNIEFQRIARRDKKAFLSDQCKEIEENNRMRKSRDLFKKIRDTKGIFHVKRGTIKDRNNTDLTEAIRRGGKKTQKNYTKNIFMTQITTMVWSLTCARLPRVESQEGLRKHHDKQSKQKWWNSNWAISNSKRWCCESAALNMSANLENSAVATGLEKVSFHSSPKEGQCLRMLKLPHNCIHLTC